MRLCPSVEGSASPLITHRIGVDVCMARQRTFFHKCHRCIYRGKPAGWQPENPDQGAIELRVAEEPARVGVVEVEAIAARSAKGGAAKGGKAKSAAARSAEA
jgi:hypothetical protein